MLIRATAVKTFFHLSKMGLCCEVARLRQTQTEISNMAKPTNLKKIMGCVDETWYSEDGREGEYSLV